jgi:indolepyruvate ferredoxin oxidoreductase beta subunit
MAQRGGTVVSHLKAGDFASPMIRPGQGHVLLALKRESVEHHEAFLRSDAWIVVNGSAHRKATRVRCVHPLKADDIAREIGHPKSANLVLLGFALARGEDRVKEGQRLYCSLQDVKSALEERLAGREDLRKACIQALEAGHGAR